MKGENTQVIQKNETIATKKTVNESKLKQK